MNVDDTELERPLAWTAILADTPVVAADGTEVGTVREVIGSVDDDIFHGIVVDVNSEAGETLIPADRVGPITDRRIEVTLTSEEIRALAPFSAPESFELGISGLLGRLHWKREGNEHP